MQTTDVRSVWRVQEGLSSLASQKYWNWEMKPTRTNEINNNRSGTPTQIVLDRVRALEKLTRRGGPGAVNDLLRALQDKNPTMRAAAADYLADLDAREAIAALVATLNDRNSEVRMSATRSLGTLLRETRNSRRLTRMLQDPDELVRVEAAESLAAIGDGKALPALWRAMHDRSPLVRSYVAGAIGSFGREQDIPRLEHRLKKERSDTVKVGIYQALYELGWRDMSTLLISLLVESRDYRVRIATAMILSEIVLDEFNAPTILDALRTALKQEQTIAGRSSIRSSLKIARQHLATNSRKSSLL